MIGQAGQWIEIPSASPLQPKKWNATFWVTFNFWWSAGLVNGLKPHTPPLSSQRNEMLIFVLCLTSNDRLGWSMDSNPIHHPSSAKTVKCSFLYYIQHLMLARLVNGLEPHPPPLSNPKMKCSFLGYVHLLMISQAVRWTQTPSATPLQQKKWNTSFMDYTQLLMIGRAEWWTQTSSATRLQPIKWNASFWIMFTSDDQPGWLMDSNPICHPSPAKQMKCSFLYYVQLLMISRAG